jgi:hypothetical protein
MYRMASLSAITRAARRATTFATVWGLATHPADANRIVAFSLFGEVYVSEDAGASWCKIAREFGEIRAAVWLTN